MNAEGITIKSNLLPEETEMYAALLSQLAIKVLFPFLFYDGDYLTLGCGGSSVVGRAR